MPSPTMSMVADMIRTVRPTTSLPVFSAIIDAHLCVAIGIHACHRKDQKMPDTRVLVRAHLVSCLTRGTSLNIWSLQSTS